MMIKYFLFRHPIGWVFWAFAYIFTVFYVGHEVLPDGWSHDAWYAIPLVMLLGLSVLVVGGVAGWRTLDYFDPTNRPTRPRR